MGGSENYFQEIPEVPPPAAKTLLFLLSFTRSLVKTFPVEQGKTEEPFGVGKDGRLCEGNTLIEKSTKNTIHVFWMIAVVMLIVG